MDSAEATTALTAAINGYQMQASDAMDIVDQLTTLDLRFAASAGGIATALSKVASVASQSGVSLEKLEAILTVTQDQTQQSAETIGNAWNSIFQRMNNIAAGKDVDDMGESLNNVDKVLSSVGLSLRDEEGQIRDLGDVLDEVAAKWDTYSRNQQNQISTAIAGTRQANYFKAAMADWEEVLEGTELAMNASGSATERMAIWSESLQGKLNSLRDSWDKFIMGLGSSEAFEDIIDILTALLDILDLLINKIPILSNLIKVTLVAQAINVLLGSLKQLKTLFGKSGLSFGGLLNVKNVMSFYNSMKTANNEIKTLGQVSSVATTSTDSLSAVLGQLAGKAVALVTANPAAAVIALTAAVAVGATAFAVYKNSIAAAEKEYKNLAEKAEESQAEVDSLEEKIAAVDNQIEAINEKGTLTLADKSQLEELEAQRKELELILAVKQNIAEADAQDSANAAKKVVNKKYGNDNIPVKINSGIENTDVPYEELITGTSSAISSNDWETIINQYDAINKKKEQGIELTDQESDRYSKLETAMNNEILSLTDYKETLELAGMESSKEYETINNMLDALQSRVATEEWQAVKLSDLIDSNDLLQNTKSTLDSLKEQLSSGLIDQETYNQKVKEILYNTASNPEIVEAMKSIYGNVEDIDTEAIANTLAEEFGYTINKAANEIDISNFEQVKQDIENEFSNLDISFDSAIENANKALENSINTESFDGIGEALDEIGNSIENYQNQISSLGDTYSQLAGNVDNSVAMLDAISEDMDALTGQTQLNGQETQDLIDKYSALGTVVDVTTGQMYNGMDVLNQTILNSGASASEMQQNVQSFMGGVTNAGNNTITAMNYVQEAIIKVKQALAGALDSAANFVANASIMLNKVGNSFGGSLVSGFFGISADDIASATSGLSSVAENLRSQADSIRDNLETQQASLINQTQQYQTKLENAGKAGQKAYGDSIAKGASSAKDATEDLTDALKEQYEAEKAILEKQKEELETQKELLETEKERLNDAKDAINNLIDMTMEMLKQQYEDEKDALDDQLDAFEDKIEKQKEYLDLQRQEQEHQDELAEKNQAIADIQAELNEIQFDNSAEAQKRRLELLSQLTDAQKDLSDYQADYDYDTKTDALDKELDSYKAMIDQKKEYITEELQSEYNLYQEAIALIEGRSNEFYNRLVEWNRVYGDHLTTTVKTAWDECYKAMDEYGYLGIGVQAILEGISARTVEIEAQNEIIENSIKSIENELDILKEKYDAATAAAEAQAKAAQNAANAANNAVTAANSMANALSNLNQAAGQYQTAQMKFFQDQITGTHGPKIPADPLKRYHSGTDYVKKANSWLDDMLGLGPNETASILKVGEAVIPDYANPFSSSGNSQSFKLDKPVGYSNSNSTQDNSVNIKIGDIVIEGNADENTVALLKKEKESILQEIFKRINKHTFLSGYKNVRTVI